VLMDFQIEGGQAVAAEIAAEMRDFSRHRRRSHEVRTFELAALALLAVFACAFAAIRAFVR